MIEVTPEQKKILRTLKNEYMEKAYTYVEPDYHKVTEWVHWLYKLANLDPPARVVIAVDRTEAEKLTGWSGTLDVKINCAVNDRIRSAGLREWDQARTVVECYRYPPLWYDDLSKLFCNNMRGRYGNYSDFGWVYELEFYTRIGLLNNEHFNKYKQLLDLGIFDTLLCLNICVVVKQPLAIKKAHEERLITQAKKQLKHDLVEADKLLDAFIQKHCTQQTT